jgi:signal transduction histidine kinase/response regulator RpfG family c-di-GMP phosphodiesterase
MGDDKVSILIVDDKPDKVLALEVLLEELGQNIVRAYSGREALRCILQREFAVILLDVNMPGMDGFETAAMIRQRPSTRHVPIIFVTAFGDEAYTHRGYSLGAVDYIQTPVVPEVLKTKVGVFVELYRKSAQVQRQTESLRRRAAQMQKLAAAAVAINSALSIERMLQTITDTARDIVGAHQAITLFVASTTDGPEPGRPITEAVASYSDKYAEWRPRKLRLDAIAGTVVARSRAATRMTVAELHDHPDWNIVRNADIPPVVGGMLAAPLTGRDGSNLGVIYLSDRYDGEFTSDDEAVLTQLAQMASIAIENTIYAAERETNRIKDEFLSTLSHELRTPLNAILGWTQLLRLDPQQDEFMHGLEVIERNARAQAKLIEDLLDVSRITTGKLRLATRPLRFSGVVDAAIDAIRPLATEKQLHLSWAGPSCTDTVAGDPDRLQQVVWNLLSNAVKFTPDSGRVDVQLDEINGQLRLRVADTGKGINPAFLPHVFDRFRQADSSSTRSHGGLGIGLTIVRHIVQLHGGSVHADSPGEGRGATFTIMLPVAMAGVEVSPTDTPMMLPDGGQGSAGHGSAGQAVASSGSSNGDGSPSSDSPANLHNARIIVVDDEADAREVMTTALRRAGANVVALETVADAVRSIAEQLPDILISDIAMPEQDGYELIRQIRSSPRTATLPAVAVTAYARAEDRMHAIVAGFDSHLPKPIDPATLVATVAQHLGARRGSALFQVTAK